MAAPQKTNFPIPFDLVQRILNQLGYFFAFQDPATQRIHFRREINPSGPAAKIVGKVSNPPHIVIILKPDFICDGYDGQVYDRDYVVDLFNKVNGQVGGEIGKNLLVFLAEERQNH